MSIGFFAVGKEFFCSHLSGVLLQSTVTGTLRGLLQLARRGIEQSENIVRRMHHV